MEEIYKRDLDAFKGRSLRDYRIREWFKSWGWTLIVPAILSIPFRTKNRKAISVLGMLSLTAVTTLATVSA